MDKKPTKPKGPQRTTTAPKPPSPYQSPTVTDDEEILDIANIPTPIRLNNCYAEWLDLENSKGERQLAMEHGVGKSSLQGRIKGLNQRLKRQKAVKGSELSRRKL
jgi:hypothetical protein